MNRTWVTVPCVAMVMAVVTSCASVRSEFAEDVFGYAKREQLVDRVEDARDAQEDAKEQFSSALDEFLALSDAPATELEQTYNRLKRELDRSESRAKAVRDRISSVERVAGALFDEWDAELGRYSSETLRQSSASQLATTRATYDTLVGTMRAASSRMDPVLTAFSDQVLFLKHNLNAQAIGSLVAETARLEDEIAVLIRDMEASIAEADRFIDQLSAG